MKTTVAIPFDFAAARPEELIDLAVAARLIPGRRAGANINPMVLQRYANPKEGAPCGPPGGERVYLVLPSLYRSGKRWTTAAAVLAFLQKRDELNNPEPASGS